MNWNVWMVKKKFIILYQDTWKPTYALFFEELWNQVLRQNFIIVWGGVIEIEWQWKEVNSGTLNVFRFIMVVFSVILKVFISFPSSYA
jgi:hypothetical protein